MGEPRRTMRSRRRLVEDRLARRGLLHTVSLARLQLRREIDRALGQYASGRMLEAGSGRSPYRDLLAGLSEVVTLDIDPIWQSDVLSDVQDMAAIPTASFDVVFSTQVLEHLPRPHEAFAEFHRVLRPGGVLVLTAPHLSMVHDAPHDYFRFTEFALTSLCEAAGFRVIEVRSVGGPLSLVAHVVSIGWMTILGGVPGLFWPVWAINRLLISPAFGLADRVLGLGRVLPRDHLVVAMRPTALA